ncbi:MAG TPA: MFS transporter [Pseudonocardiaceae bacterium]|nr:MFS transporter [Pseudonocardiaceae bacterium]
MTERTLIAAPRTVAPPRTRAGLVLAIILTCQLMLVLDVTVMNVALPRIQTDLHFTSTGLSWVMSAYTLVYGCLLLLGGRAGDLLGRRRMFVIGVAVFTIASLAGGLAQSAAWLVIARIVQGLGAAAAGPSTLALITSTITEPKARIRALALFSAMASGGFAVGLIVGGLLTELGSWRLVMFINVPFGIAVTILALRFVGEPQRHPARLDLPGALTSTLGVAGLVYAFIRAASVGWSDPLVLVTLTAGVVLLGLFVLLERRAAQPLLRLSLLADGNRARAYLNFFLAPMALMSMFFFLTQFIQDVLGLKPLATGFAFLPMAASTFVVSRFVPRLLPRFGAKVLTATGSALTVIGLIWLTQLSVSSGYFGWLLGPLLLMGIGMGLAFPPLNVIIMSTVPARDAGAAGGVLQTMQQVGGSLGLAVLVTVFGRVSATATGRHESAAQVLVSGMTSAYVVAAVAAVAAFVVALTFRRETAANG